MVLECGQQQVAAAAVQCSRRGGEDGSRAFEIFQLTDITLIVAPVDQ